MFERIRYHLLSARRVGDVELGRESTVRVRRYEPLQGANIPGGGDHPAAALERSRDDRFPQAARGASHEPHIFGRHDRAFLSHGCSFSMGDVTGASMARVGTVIQQ